MLPLLISIYASTPQWITATMTLIQPQRSVYSRACSRNYAVDSPSRPPVQELKPSSTRRKPRFHHWPPTLTNLNPSRPSPQSEVNLSMDFTVQIVDSATQLTSVYKYMPSAAFVVGPAIVRSHRLLITSTFSAMIALLSYGGTTRVRSCHVWKE